MVKIKKRNYSLKGFSKFRNKKIKTRKQNIKRGGMVNDGDEDEDEYYVGMINEAQPINNIMANYNNIMDRSLIDDENNIYSIVMARRETPYQYEDVEMVNEILLRLENRIVELENLGVSLTHERRVIETRVIQMLGEEGLLSEEQRSLLTMPYYRERTMRQILSEREQKKYYQNYNQDDAEQWQPLSNRLLINESWLSSIIVREKEVDDHWNKMGLLKRLLSELLPKPEPEPEPEYETKDGDDDSQNGGKKNKKNKRKKSIKRKGKKV
jgi:hypothetical protein